MEGNETMIRTVPPRPKGYGALGVLGGLLLTAGIVWGWRAMQFHILAGHVAPHHCETPLDGSQRGRSVAREAVLEVCKHSPTPIYLQNTGFQNLARLRVAPLG